MKKVGKSLVLLALGATAICGIGFAAKAVSKETPSVVNATYTPGTTYEVEDPSVYYAGIDDSKSGTALLDDLRSLNLGKRRSTIGYGSMGTSASSSAYVYTDYDPNTVQYDKNNQPYGTKVLSFYSGRSVTGWNREHVWPNSRGGGSGGKAGSPYPDADIYMPRPTVAEENSNRGNSKYVEGMCHSSNGWDPVTAFASTLGVYEGIRGECARIIFYCMTVNSKLVLDDTATGGTTGVTMGKISDLLKWHLTNPVNPRELTRQSGGQYLQGNRNAFVDHRSYACKIWGNTNQATKSLCDQYNGWSEDDPEKSLVSISVSGTPTKKVYFEGESFNKAGLTVTATYSNETTENVTSKVTVSPDPLTLGTTSVTLSYKYGSDTKTATVSGITVHPVIPVTNVTIINAKTNYFIGESCDIETTVLPDDATYKALTYSTNNASVASVDSTGHVLFKAAGSVTITAQANNGVKDSITFSVTKRQIPVTGIEASLPSSSYFVGDTANIQYTVLPTNADNKSVSFSSSNTSIASVTSTGSVLFNSAGDVTLTVKSKEDQSIAATIDVTVSEKPVVEVPVDSVIFDSVKSKVEVGETVQLFANIYPENATNKTLTYSSSDNNIAEVSASGLVTFKAAGSVTITAKSHNDKTATMIFKVSAVPTPESKLFEIAITNKPSKLVYSVGETFSESGLEVKAHYLDGSSKEITSEVVVTTPDTSTAGSKKVTVSYNDTFTTEFEIAVVEETVSQLRITKFPLKTNYFPTEEFSPLGLKASAKFNEEVRDVSELVTFQYNFSVSNRVLVCFKNLSVNIEVTIESGEITDDHKAADFAYIVENKVADVDDIQAVTINDWNSFEYNYNTLDEGAKQVLKIIVTDYSGGAASAENQLTEKLTDCVKKYDLTYLDHKDEGFNDFMGRNPQDNAQDKKGTDKKLIIALVGIGVGVIVLVTIIIIVAVAVSKKGKKKHA